MLRKVENLEDYFVDDYGKKELRLKIFKVNLVQFSNIIDEELLAKMFGDTLEALAGKIINTTDKEKY